MDYVNVRTIIIKYCYLRQCITYNHFMGLKFVANVIQLFCECKMFKSLNLTAIVHHVIVILSHFRFSLELVHPSCVFLDRFCH